MSSERSDQLNSSRSPIKHLDEARRDALGYLRDAIDGFSFIEKSVLISDLFGLQRLIVWTENPLVAEPARVILNDNLEQVAQRFWTGTIWICSSETTKAARDSYEALWADGVEVTQKLRVNDRHRTKSAWFNRPRLPIWAVRGASLKKPTRTGPPVIVFWSFKGGVGRTTALAAFAIQRARLGERVTVVDFDLDAPGVGTLLAADTDGTTTPWGTVDYLLERPHGEVLVGDYLHRCARPQVTGDGEIWVMPAGKINRDYINKLSRVDLEVTSSEQETPLETLLNDLNPSKAERELTHEARRPPHWILIDARAGLSSAGGLLLSGLAHLHILFSTTNEQSLLGLERVVHHLGAERLHGDVQSDCLLVQAMVPDNTVTAKEARAHFNSRVEAIFREHYYVKEEDDPEDALWSVRDIDNTQAPHASIPIPYRDAFSFFRNIDDISPILATDSHYADLDARIKNRFPSYKPTKELD